MQYEDRLRDSIARSIHIMDNYNGEYEVTLMINTAYIVIGQIIEYYTKKKKKEISKVYELISDKVKINNPQNKEMFKVFRTLRNSLAHYHIKMEGERTIDRIILRDNSIYFELDEFQLMDLIHEFPKLI